MGVMRPYLLLPNNHLLCHYAALGVCPHHVHVVLVCFQGNVGPAAFWLLGYLLTNSKALMAVKREFSQISQMETSETPVFGESSIPA